jgi:hypothetical protein
MKKRERRKKKEEKRTHGEKERSSTVGLAVTQPDPRH